MQILYSYFYVEKSFQHSKFFLFLSLFVFRSQLPDLLADSPYLHVSDGLELLLQLLSVVRLRVELQGSLGLAAVLGGLVQVLEHGLQGVLEDRVPVQSTTSGGGGARVVHVVHAVLADQRVQRLRGLLDGLVEGLAWGVAVLPQHLVLGQKHTVDTAHQTASLTVQVTVDLLLERGLVHVPGPDRNGQRLGLLVRLTRNILPDGVGGVDTTALFEQGPHGSAGALGGDQDSVDVGWWLDVGQVLEDRGEPVGEVQGLVLGQQWLQRAPCLGLRSVGKQVHDVGTLLDGLLDLEQVLAWHPAVLDGGLPGGTVLTDTDDDVQTVVSHVQTLAVTLGTVADQRKGVVGEVLQQLLSWPVGTLVHSLDSTTEVDLLQTTLSDHWLGETGCWLGHDGTGDKSKSSLGSDNTGVANQSGSLGSDHFYFLLVGYFFFELNQKEQESKIKKTKELSLLYIFIYI